MSPTIKWTQTNRASADQPAQSIKDDLLGRGLFAASLAKAMINWTEPESLVVSLTGPWGSGKSSVVNFIVEIIQKEPAESRADVLRFNPWQSAERLDAGERLLREIAITLRHDYKSAENQQIAKKWHQWSAALRLSTSTFDAFSKIPSMLSIAGLLGLFASLSIEYPAVGVAFKITSAIALAAGIFLQGSASIAEKAAAYFTAQATASERTLDELRAELRSAMVGHDRKLIIIIDDIDRLPQAEVQALFRTVRANADFPKLIFLLVFERNVVERALADQAHVDGNEYLKKIIQVPFSIPRSDPNKVQNVLSAALNDVLNNIPNTVPFDNKRWADVFSGGISHYFPTLRDVYRYMTTFAFHLGLFQSSKTMEVNQIDLIALETLRVFEPRLYEALPRFKKLLTHGPGRVRSFGSDPKQLVSSEVDVLLSFAQKAENHSAIKQILSGVFQPFEWLVKNYGSGSGFEEGWERELRACSESYFERYFYFSIQDNEISQAEIEAVLNAVSERERLVEELKRLHERGALETMLNRMEAYKETISLDVAVPFITALFDVGDHLPGASKQFFIGPEMHAIRIVFHYLRRVPIVADRERILIAAIKATTGLQLPVRFVRLDERKKDRKESEYVVSEARLPELRALCVEKIRSASENGRLIHHTEMASLMYDWLHWTDGAAVRAWARTIASSSIGALALIRGFVRESHVYRSGYNSTETHHELSVDALEDFVPTDILESSVEKLDKGSLTQEDSATVLLFTRELGDWRANSNKEDPNKR